MSPRVRHARANLGAHVRRDHDPEVIDAARAELADANAEAAVLKIVDGWPPLTAGQLGRLAAIFLSAARDRDAKGQ